MSHLTLVLGNQLFDPKYLRQVHPPETTTIFMREDAELCTYYKFHKHKLVLFLSAMRTYAEELRAEGYKVHYEELGSTKEKLYDKSLEHFIKTHKIKEVTHFEVEDKFFETRLSKLFSGLNVENEVLESPMFVTSREKFRVFLGAHHTPLMRTFYERQRIDLRVLVNKDNSPLKGKWSFDSDNRKPLPKKMNTPSLPKVKPSPIVEAVKSVIEESFPTHPGSVKTFWLPVDRSGAKSWLKNFLDERFSEFGPYEDALPFHSDFFFHSVLTPFLNTGLLTPLEVLESALAYAEKKEVPYASLEGFVRQIVGWRVYVRGIYQNFSEIEDVENFWGHEGKLTKVWYDGGSGVPVLDSVIDKVNRFGYAHHIERLMVVGNLMLLSGVAPAEAHRWYMEMFIDSSDWVMGPNVYGMAIYSDGGIFTTKPYICGSNYYRKMSGSSKGEWSDGVDGLYWGFINDHKDFFLKNPRTSLSVRTLERMDPTHRKEIFAAGKELRAKLVH